MQDLKQLLINYRGDKTLMVIYPHPDDETMAAGGLLLVTKELGFKTIAVLLTKGAAGQVHVHPHGKSLKELREMELKKAAKILNIDELVMGDFDDGKLKDQNWSSWVKEQLEKYQPGIVVTYDHSGLSGHPDHIALSLEIKKLVSKKTILLWSTISPEFAKRIINPKTLEFASTPDYELDLRKNWIKKWRAARAHASQALGKGMPMPLGALFAWQHYEWYHKVDLNKDYPYKFVEFKI